MVQIIGVSKPQVLAIVRQPVVRGFAWMNYRGHSGNCKYRPTPDVGASAACGMPKGEAVQKRLVGGGVLPAVQYGPILVGP